MTSSKHTSKVPVVVPARRTTTENNILKTTTAAPPIKIPTKSTPSKMSTAAVLPSRTGDGGDGGGGGVNLGLAIGLPIFFLVLIVVLIVLFICWRKHKKHKTFSIEDPNHNGMKRKGKPEIYIRTPSREGTQLYIVRHAFEAQNDTELSLTNGQFVQVLEKGDGEQDGWMRGTIDDEKEGWFPAKCVNKLKCVDQPAFGGDMAKLEIQASQPLDEDVDDEEAECQSLEDVDHPPAVADRSEPTEDVEPPSSRRVVERSELNDTQQMEGFVNASFQINDEVSDHERNTKNEDLPVIVDAAALSTEPVAAPRKHIQGAVSRGRGSDSGARVTEGMESTVAQPDEGDLKTKEITVDGGKKGVLRLDAGLTDTHAGKFFVAEEVFTPTSPNHLRLGKGDMLCREEEQSDWMKGTNIATGERGWFPSEYVSEKEPSQELKLKVAEITGHQPEEITPTIAYNVRQAPVDDSMADQSGKSIDISAAEHSGIGTSIDATASDKPLPGHHRKELSDDLGPPSPDSGFDSPRQNVKPAYEDQDVAVCQVTSGDSKDTEVGDKEKKAIPDIPTRFVTPKLVKIARKPSDGKDVEHQQNVSGPVTQLSTKESIKDNMVTPEEKEHDAKFGDANSDKSGTPEAKESFVDDFMNRTMPETGAVETSVTEECAISPEPENGSVERPDVPTKPARLKFWNKRPKSLSQLLHVNLPGSFRKNRTASESLVTEEKEKVKSPHDLSPEAAPTSPKEKPPRPTKPPTLAAQSPVNGDLSSPTGKLPKPPRPTSPPLRSPDGKKTGGFPKVMQAATDTHEKDASQETAGKVASPSDSGKERLVEEIKGKAYDIPHNAAGEVVSYGTDGLNATPEADDLDKESELSAAEPDAVKASEQTKDDVPSSDSLHDEPQVPPSSAQISNGDSEPNNNKGDSKEEDVVSPAVALKASGDANTIETEATPAPDLDKGVEDVTTINLSSDSTTDEPTPDPTSKTEVKTSSNVNNDTGLQDEEEKPELPGDVEHKPEQPELPGDVKHKPERPELPGDVEHKPEQPELPGDVEHKPEQPELPGDVEHKPEQPELPGDVEHKPEQPELPGDVEHKPEQPELPGDVEHKPEQPELPGDVEHKPEQPELPGDVEHKPEQPELPGDVEHKPEQPELPGDVEQNQELSVKPVEPENYPSGGTQDLEPPVVPETLPPVDTSPPDRQNYKMPLESPVQVSPDTSPSSQDPNVSPLRFFTPASFVPVSSSTKRELNFGVQSESENSPKNEYGEMKMEKKEGGKDNVSPLRFFTPAGFVPGSPSPKQELDFNVPPVEPVKTDVKIETEDKPNEGEVSPFKLFTPAGFVARSPSPNQQPVVVSATEDVVKDDDMKIKTEDEPSETKKKEISPLRFFTPPKFAPQHGHYGTVQLPESVVDDKQETGPEDMQSGEDYQEDGITQKDKEDDRSTSSSKDNPDVDKQKDNQDGDIITTHNDINKDNANLAAIDTSITNGDKEVDKNVMSGNDASKYITDDTDINTSVNSDTDIDTHLRFFTPAQFTPLSRHHDKISPVHAPTNTLYKAPEEHTETKESATEPPKVTTEPLEVMTEPPEVMTEPPKVMTEPPKVVTEPPTLTTEPPKLMTEPPKVTTEPPKVTTEPPKVITEPPKVTTEPPKVMTEPPKVMTEPPKEMTEPPKVTTEPPEVMTEPPKEMTEPPKVMTEPPKEKANVIPSEPANPSERIAPVTTSSPEEHWKELNGHTRTEDGTSKMMFSSPPLSPTLFTATGYSSPKSYQPFHKFNAGSSPLVNNMSGDTSELTGLTPDDGPPDDAIPTLPQEAADHTEGVSSGSRREEDRPSYYRDSTGNHMKPVPVSLMTVY
ncbi:hypothetical protein LSAT2_019472 [Lamellibrachia satsuma]|nr:hypothetical protein LSAT2_019472 [Lamellibrachia satsuma]